MKLRFTKMHGLGNDFVVLDGVSQPIALSTDQLKRIGDRHFGIGCDQILLVENPHHPEADFRYRIFNGADGGEVEQCGNGSRCFVRFVHDKGLSRKPAIRVETAKGLIVPQLEANGLVTVDMGEPRFQPAEIPFVADEEAVSHPVLVGESLIEMTVVSMGNPHAVQVVVDIDAAPVVIEGPLIESHPRFPARVNAGYMQIVSRCEIRLRVFERSAGETLACGSGACAAVVAGIRRGLLDTTVLVHTRGGDLSINWDGPGYPVKMTGPAVTVFEGEIDI
ncbi:diaminopimelate epimerase [Chitinimonas sp. BJB300]|uniref:diaminopimelate epimerase n=1 Tax=Chitinimonas sp. BJB300 TaxID=1559339 RepID=UPI000C11525C|nr:diaminopimelate epimerase [Chitinimonas sp. BJB300]PHV12367.1 diaminopimelate epimerase [Chitinimonas sp. BJB300]TSJ91076.1 diaminopimelate epimerase [Chitinimonas sp. BJB300]